MQTASSPSGMVATIWRGGVGNSLHTLRMISEVLGAMNGGRPVKIS